MLDAQVLQHALADPADEVGLRVGGAPVHERRRQERDDDEVQRRRRRRGDARRRWRAWPAAAGASDAAVANSSATNISACARGTGAAARPCRAACARARRSAQAPADLLEAGPGVRRAGSQARHLRSTRLARQEDLVGQALLGDLARTARSARAARRACRGRATAPSSSTTISSASAIVDSRWAITNVVRPAITSRSACLDLLLGRGVDRGGGVVEDEDARVGQQRAGDRDPLALAAREREPALADPRVVAVRQLGDEAVRLGAPGRALDLLARRVRRARRRCSRAPWRRTGTGRRRRRRSARRSEARSTRARRRRRPARGPSSTS